MEKYLQTYLDTRRKIIAYNYMGFLFSWDQETEAPSASHEFRSEQFQVIVEEAYKLSSDPAYMEAIEKLYENLNLLEHDLQVEIKKQYKDLRWVKKIPKDEFIDYQVLTQNGSNVWQVAKMNNDFLAFQPTLEKIVEYLRKFVKYFETDTLKGYDVLLDMYEEGMGINEYDAFFNKLREDLVPFVLEVTKNKPIKFSRKLTHSVFPSEQQREFSHYLMDVFHYDKTKGLLKESAHPFTNGVASVDTRITTHFHEDNLVSSIFSTIHEMGHGIYEMQNDPKYDKTFLHGGTSMGIHESQSRMYENMLGRAKEFWEVHYSKLVEIFPKQLKNVTVDEFVQYINTAKRSLIRIEADELTYSLHIMVRYELEKLLINGKLKVKDLPKKWKQLMGEYVGIRPKNDAEGVLQDIHWSGGSLGYFPTYALGSAYAAQIYHAMNQEIDIKEAIQNNQMDKINAWSKEHIHKYASSKTPKELMLIATKEPFNPMYYVNYLKEKFSK